MYIMVFVPPSGPPKESPPKIYSILGEENIRKLLKYHYKFLSESEIKDLFPTGIKLEESANKNADFFIQALGGPPYFTQKYGPPMMRARHLKFPIDYKKREVWLNCFFKAIEELKKEIDFPEEEEKKFKDFLIRFSEWMVNHNE